MPLSFIMGLSDPSTVRGLEWLCDRGVDAGVPILRPERLAYVGLRDVDVYERKVLHRLRKEHGLFASTMQVSCQFFVDQLCADGKIDSDIHYIGSYFLQQCFVSVSVF